MQQLDLDLRQPEPDWVELFFHADLTLVPQETLDRITAAIINQRETEVNANEVQNTEAPGS